MRSRDDDVGRRARMHARSADMHVCTHVQPHMHICTFMYAHANSDGSGDSASTAFSGPARGAHMNTRTHARTRIHGMHLKNKQAQRSRRGGVRGGARGTL